MCEVVVFVCGNVNGGGLLFGVVFVCDGKIVVCVVNEVFGINDFIVYVEM